MKSKQHNGTLRKLIAGPLLSMLLLATGCQAPHQRLNNLDRLKAHPEFRKAAAAAPNFVKEVGKTIADLELQIEQK